jgi:glucose/arabinose dehydrogenase
MTSIRASVLILSMSWRVALAMIVVATVTLTAQAPTLAGEKPPTMSVGNPLIPPEIQWPSPALGDGPFNFLSAEHWKLKVTVVAKGLSHPWAMAFLPDGTILVTERPGRIRVLRKGALDPAPVAGVPKVIARGLGGLMDIVLHPQFAGNHFVYLTYHKAPAEGAPSGPALALARGTWDGTALRDVHDIFVGNGDASRIAFSRDGLIFMSSSGPGVGPGAMRAQDPNNYAGKILRLRDDGSVPSDNPFVGRTGYKPEIFSIGHRSVLGLAVHPESGELWATEMGPNGGDEINLILPGKNYGWPLVSAGRWYIGPRVTERPPDLPFEEPIVSWVPSISVSGLTFYTGDKFPKWKRNVFVGGLREGEVPRTGQVQRIVFNDKWEEIRRESLLRDLHQRIRAVHQGPDGCLYVLTDEDEGAILRIEPGE